MSAQHFLIAERDDWRCWLPAPREGFTHVREGIADFLDSLQGEVEEHVERHGGLRGRDRPRQRRGSRVPDQVEIEHREAIG
jgi:hypothetical protein